MEQVIGYSHIGPVLNGSLTSSPQVFNVQGHPLPCTITLDSSAGGRLIELSTDGGVNYFTPTAYDATTTNMINIGIVSPITNIRLSGNVNDKYFVN